MSLLAGQLGGLIDAARIEEKSEAKHQRGERPLNYDWLEALVGALIAHGW